MNPTPNHLFCPRLRLRAWYPSIWSAQLAIVLLVALLLPLAARSTPADAQGASPVAEAAPYRLPENTDELLRLDDEMRAFFAARINRRASIEDRIDQVVEAILGEEGMQFRYETGGLYDVREAFRRRRGNCMTYSMLVVAIAREFRIQAVFNEVRLRPNWGRLGRIVLESRHINVQVEAMGKTYEIDLKMFENLRSPRTTAWVVSDAQAFAALYSNAGVYRLAAGDRAGALPLLERATQIDPHFAPGWSNQGGLHLLAGDTERARRCYEQALAEEPETMSAVSALAWVYREAGRIEEAERMERTAARYREHNPYYLLSEAQTEFDNGNLEAARKHLARAIRIKDDEPQLFELMVRVSRGLGFEREAERYSRRLDDFRRHEVAAAQ